MRRLILIKHSLPVLQHEVPAAEWRLAEDGAARARVFAGRIDSGSATRVYSSTEPKAVATARILAEKWELPVEEVRHLHEHERPEPGLLNPREFEARVRELFAAPHALVMGAETAAAARRRFTAALMRLTMRDAHDVIVVTHGTVLTLFAAEAAGVEPYGFWKGLGLPSAAVFSMPELQLLQVLNWNDPAGR